MKLPSVDGNEVNLNINMYQLSLQPRSREPFISLIIPVFNEEVAIAHFTTVVTEILHNLNSTYELLFINDGSQDRTLEQLLQHSQTDTHIRILNFSRNFGKEAALTAGIDAAQGDVLIPIDIDLQDPPELISQFLAKWHEGYDVVYGIRVDRANDSITKKTTSYWFYRFFNYIAYIDIPADVGDFRLIDRRVAEVLKQLPERNRFMKGLFAWVGFSSIGIPYTRPIRAFGTTKWNYWKLWNFALDGLISFSNAPLRLWSYIGGGIAVVSFLYAIFIIFRVIIMGLDMPGYASLMCVILFMGGIQLLSIGIIGEYLGRLFIETKKRPIYILEGIYHYGTREHTELK